MKVTLFRDLPSERWFSMERYADELFAALQALGANARQYVWPRPWPQLQGRAGAWFNHFWRMAVYPLAVSAQQGDVNHILDHSYAHLLYRLDPRRAVVTCHDIAPLALSLRPGLSRKLWGISFQALSRAAQIICVSAYTRDELARHRPELKARLSVILEGVHPVTPTGDTAPTPNLVLHVGSCQPRKNLPVLLRALAQVPHARLVQVGGQPDEALRAFATKLGVAPRVQWMGAVSEADLHQWYRTAGVFVFPSTYEGFGLPVLEAMAAGVPVICSNATSLPEVAGEAALLFEPHDATALAAHLQTVLADQPLHARLIQAGYAQSQKFTWENTARATLKIYRQVANL
jgi:glycosyltransferase involved in cell wall biosynthesis